MNAQRGKDCTMNNPGPHARYSPCCRVEHQPWEGALGIDGPRDAHGFIHASDYTVSRACKACGAETAAGAWLFFHEVCEGRAA